MLKMPEEVNFVNSYYKEMVDNESESVTESPSGNVSKPSGHGGQ